MKTHRIILRNIFLKMCHQAIVDKWISCFLAVCSSIENHHVMSACFLIQYNQYILIWHLCAWEDVIFSQQVAFSQHNLIRSTILRRTSIRNPSIMKWVTSKAAVSISIFAVFIANKLLGLIGERRRSWYHCQHRNPRVWLFLVNIMQHIPCRYFQEIYDKMVFLI